MRDRIRLGIDLGVVFASGRKAVRVRGHGASLMGRRLLRRTGSGFVIATATRKRVWENDPDHPSMRSTA